MRPGLSRQPQSATVSTSANCHVCCNRLEVKGSRELAFFKGKAVGASVPWLLLRV